MKIRIDQDKCIGCGACAVQCPAVFKLNNETGKAEVLKIEGSKECDVESAKISCPVNAISVE